MLDAYSHFFFVGIAGTGMSAIAQYLRGKGKEVSGSDRLFGQGQKLLSETQFEAMGINCYFQDGRGVGKNDIRRGDVAGHTDNAPTVAKEFDAQVVVLQHPGVITVGYTPVFHCHTSQVACTFLDLSKKLNPATGAVDEENPDFLKTGNAAIVKIKPTKPMCLENAKEIPQMGRFAIRDMGQTVAAGLCLNVTPAK